MSAGGALLGVDLSRGHVLYRAALDARGPFGTPFTSLHAAGGLWFVGSARGALGVARWDDAAPRPTLLAEVELDPYEGRNMAPARRAPGEEEEEEGKGVEEGDAGAGALDGPTRRWARGGARPVPRWAPAVLSVEGVERARACVALTADGHVRVIDVPSRRVVASRWGHAGAAPAPCALAAAAPAGGEAVVAVLGRDEALSCAPPPPRAPGPLPLSAARFVRSSPARGAPTASCGAARRFWDLTASHQLSSGGACALALGAPRATDLAAAVSEVRPSPRRALQSALRPLHHPDRYRNRYPAQRPQDLSATRAAKHLAEAARGGVGLREALRFLAPPPRAGAAQAPPPPIVLSGHAASLTPY
jgi:hypothetical protein